MNVKTKIGLAIVYSVTIFAFGRYLAPTKVITETKTVEVEKKTDDKLTDKKKKSKKKIIIVENTTPDGAKEKTTTITDDTTTTDKSKESSTTDKSKSNESRKEVTRDTDKVTVSFLAGSNLLSPDPINPLLYGLSITKPILGPFTLGAFVFQTGLVGGSLGLTF